MLGPWFWVERVSLNTMAPPVERVESLQGCPTKGIQKESPEAEYVEPCARYPQRVPRELSPISGGFPVDRAGQSSRFGRQFQVSLLHVVYGATFRERESRFQGFVSKWVCVLRVPFLGFV